MRELLSLIILFYSINGYSQELKYQDHVYLPHIKSVKTASWKSHDISTDQRFKFSRNTTIII